MKYIIELEDEPMKGTFEKDVNYYRCKQIPYWSLSETMINKLTPYPEPDRKAIEDEVWEFARGLLNYTDDDWEVITNMLLLDIPYQEAKAKFEAWLKQKDEPFDTGDEVYDKEIDSKGVILRRYNSDTLDILWDDGSAGETISIKAITKTGRHFPEVAEMLKKMRGEEE